MSEAIVWVSSTRWMYTVPKTWYLLESVRERILKVQGEARMFNVMEKWWQDMMYLFFCIEFMIINYPRAWDAGGRSGGKNARDSWANIFSSTWSTVHRVKPYDVARCFCGNRVCTHDVWTMLKMKSLSFVEQTKPRYVKKWVHQIDCAYFWPEEPERSFVSSGISISELGCVLLWYGTM